MLEHIANPSALISEIGRILAPGGKLIGSVPFSYRLHEEPYDYYRYTRHALKRLGQQSGLEVQELKPYGQGLDVVFDSVGKVIVDALWHWGPRMLAWLQTTGLKVRASRLGRRINSAHVSMPLGYILVFQRDGRPGSPRDS